MARRYLVTDLPKEGRIELPREVSHHLARVTRAKVGDSVVLFDGAGYEADGRVATVGRGSVEVEIAQHRVAEREPDVAVEVAFALPRAQRADWLFEHGCEVGVARFRPLLTERTRVQGKDHDNKVERWTRIVQAAAGQCDRARVPIVDPPRPLSELLTAPDLPKHRFLATVDGAPLGPAPGPSVLAIGPEGGFTEGELAQLLAAGFLPASLGVLTLRTETAGLVGAVRLLG